MAGKRNVKERLNRVNTAPSQDMGKDYGLSEAAAISSQQSEAAVVEGNQVGNN